MRGQKGGLDAQPGLDFDVQSPRQFLVHFHLVVHRVGEPCLQVDVEHLVAPQHQEENRDAAQQHGAHHQFGADARTQALGLARHIELDELASQNPPHGDHQDEDQGGNRPENEGLPGVGRAKIPETKGALPHHQHHADDKQHAGGPVEQALSHGSGAYLMIIRSPCRQPRPSVEGHPGLNFPGFAPI